MVAGVDLAEHTWVSPNRSRKRHGNHINYYELSFVFRCIGNLGSLELIDLLSVQRFEPVQLHVHRSLVVVMTTRRVGL